MTGFAVRPPPWLRANLRAHVSMGTSRAAPSLVHSGSCWPITEQTDLFAHLPVKQIVGKDEQCDPNVIEAHNAANT